MGGDFVLRQIEVFIIFLNDEANFSYSFAIVDGFDGLDAASQRHCELDVIIHGVGENICRHQLEVVDACLTWIVGRDCDYRSWVLSYEIGKASLQKSQRDWVFGNKGD